MIRGHGIYHRLWKSWIIFFIKSMQFNNLDRSGKSLEGSCPYPSSRAISKIFCSHKCNNGTVCVRLWRYSMAEPIWSRLFHISKGSSAWFVRNQWWDLISIPEFECKFCWTIKTLPILNSIPFTGDDAGDCCYST